MSDPIPTSVSLAGRLAGDPRLRTSVDGTTYVRVRVDVFPPRRRQQDGEHEPSRPLACDLVGFEKVANVLHSRFRFGDWFVASGQLNPGKGGTPSFIARRIGHDAVHADYTLRRTGAKTSRRNRGAARRAPAALRTAAGAQPIVAGRIPTDHPAVFRSA